MSLAVHVRLVKSSAAWAWQLLDLAGYLPLAAGGHRSQCELPVAEVFADLLLNGLRQPAQPKISSTLQQSWRRKGLSSPGYTSTSPTTVVDLRQTNHSPMQRRSSRLSDSSLLRVPIMWKCTFAVSCQRIPFRSGERRASARQSMCSAEQYRRFRNQQKTTTALQNNSSKQTDTHITYAFRSLATTCHNGHVCVTPCTVYTRMRHGSVTQQRAPSPERVAVRETCQ